MVGEAGGLARAADLGRVRAQAVEVADEVGHGVELAVEDEQPGDPEGAEEDGQHAEGAGGLGGQAQGQGQLLQGLGREGVEVEVEQRVEAVEHEPGGTGMPFKLIGEQY